MHGATRFGVGLSDLQVSLSDGKIRMNRLTASASAVACCLLLLACTTPRQTLPGLVLSDVTVISPERAAPLTHAYVRIVGGKITEVSERPLRGERQIDGTGRYLIPGLIDSHVHLAVSPGYPAAMTAEQAREHPEIVAGNLAQDPRSFLFHGFTTVIDLVGTPERTAQWNAYLLRPDAFFCGAAAVINGQTRQILYPYFSYDKTFEQRLAPIDAVPSTSEAVAARIAASGAICLKTVHDRGLEPTVEEGQALVAAAHAHKLPVLIHANRKRSQAFAVAAGVDAIVHGMWRDPDEDAALDDEARRILADVARRKIGYQPTTQVIASLRDMLRKDYFARPVLADAYTRTFIDWCARKESNCSSTHWSRTFGPDAEERLRATVARAHEVTQVLFDADARLLFGSDTPSDAIYTNPPGLNGRIEMEHWIAAGVPLDRLFRALTIDNARMFRLDDRIGTVEPGKIANLLLLNANPLENVNAYDAIETVFLHGLPVDRDELSARNAPP
jgi:imidazolonepropionase-like amidohydrolase